MAMKASKPKYEAVSPYCVPNRQERSRVQAKKRRVTQKTLMEELAVQLPFSKEVVSQVDTKTTLRLALCYFRLKSLLGGPQPARRHTSSCTSLSPLNGVLHDLMTEALDGFLMVVVSDGTIVYLSETVHRHMGLFQSEYIGSSVYDLVHVEDHDEVREKMEKSEAMAMAGVSEKGVAPCSFFCRFKTKRTNTHLKTPGYKLVYISGHYRVDSAEPYLVCVVHPVTPPTVLEIKLEGNMFVTHHNLNMKITFYDGRLHSLLGYKKRDLVGQSLFGLHHHDDIIVTMTCSKKLHQKGESVTGYYRFLTHYGHYVWLQTRGTMMVDRRTGKPSYIVCMHFVISKDKGDESLSLRNMLTNQPSNKDAIIIDPLPVPRGDEAVVNPLGDPTPPPNISSSSSSSFAQSLSGSLMDRPPAVVEMEQQPAPQEVESNASPESRSVTDSVRLSPPSLPQSSHSTPHPSPCPSAGNGSFPSSHSNATLSPYSIPSAHSSTPSSPYSSPFCGHSSSSSPLSVPFTQPSLPPHHHTPTHHQFPSPPSHSTTPPITVPSPWTGSSGAYPTEHAHTRHREDSGFCSAGPELASLDLASLESLTQDFSFPDVFTSNGVNDEGYVFGAGYQSNVSSPPEVPSVRVSPFNAHPGLPVLSDRAHQDTYISGVEYTEFFTLSNGSAPPDCPIVSSNGYTASSSNMAWDTSPQTTSASEVLMREASSANSHPPMVSEADSTHHGSPELLVNTEISSDHGPRQSSSLLKLLLTPKSAKGPPSSQENGHSTHITPSVTHTLPNHHHHSVSVQKKTCQQDYQCAVHAVNGSSSSLVVTNGSVSTLGGHAAAFGADTQLEDVLQQLL